MFSIYETIVLFVIFGNSVHDCSEVIGNYTNIKSINDKSCGTSLFSSELKGCFKYHNDLPLNLKDARNALPGEAPWSVLLLTYRGGYISACGGALVTEQWVLTAAHCITNQDGTVNNDTVYVHLNPTWAHDFTNTPIQYWSTEPKHRHHLFKFDYNSTDFLYDIGLIKLNKPIVIKSHFVNPICLPPERNFTSIEEQYAMITGWHTIYNWNNPSLNRLQISYLKVSSHTTLRYNSTDRLFYYQEVNGSYFIWPGYIFGQRLEKQKICDGDSGSPVWQYHHGRAVLIGVFVQLSSNENDSGCEFDVYPAPMYYPNGTAVENVTETQSFLVWVPMMMDWVKNVIQNN